MRSEIEPRIPSREGEPAWEAAYFFPPQGSWGDEDFLQFHTNRMAELVAGRLEILPMPTWLHQKIVRWLLELVENAAEQSSMTLFAPLPLRLFPGTIREPDLLYFAPASVPAANVDYPTAADLVMEIVSEGAEAHRRDYHDKRIDYAKAGVREYWIVDPHAELITVLYLNGREYELVGEFRANDTARSRLLPGLLVSLEDFIALCRTSANNIPGPN